MAILDTAVGLLTGGGLAALAAWIKSRGRTAVAREAGAAQVVDDLLGEVRSQREELREVRSRVESERQARLDGERECREQLRRAEEGCDKRLAEQLREADARTREAVDTVRRDLLRISARVRTSLPADDTGRIELEGIEERQRRASAPRLPAVRREPKTQRREGDDR